MYEAFYKLEEDPFRLLPDPQICFPHRSCARAWAYLRYALQRGEGIVVVTGEPGSGKTTLGERLLNELNASKTVSVRLVAGDLSATDLLRKLAYALGIPAEGMDRAMLTHRIERHLIDLDRTRRSALVLIDEAQKLSHRALEAMRLLTDLQSHSHPVMQLFLMGQEELEGVMAAPGMEQFQQRVIASCRLQKMDLAETKAYLEYRLDRANWTGDPSVDGPAMAAIYRHSRGLPRHVNKICSRLFLHGCTEEKHKLTEDDVSAVVRDLRDELLAPTDEHFAFESQSAGGVFDSVYELALVPAVKVSPATRQPIPTLNLSEDRPDVAPGGGHVATDRRSLLDASARAGGDWPDSRDWPTRPDAARRVRGSLESLGATFSRLLRVLGRRWRAMRGAVPRLWAALHSPIRQVRAAIFQRSRLFRPKAVPLAARLSASADGSRGTGISVPLALATVAVVALLLGGSLLLGDGSDERSRDSQQVFKHSPLLPDVERMALAEGASVLDGSNQYLELVEPDRADGRISRLVQPDLSMLVESGIRVPGVERSALPQSSAEQDEAGLLSVLSVIGGDVGNGLLSAMGTDTAEAVIGTASHVDSSLHVWSLAQLDGDRGLAPSTPADAAGGQALSAHADADVHSVRTSLAAAAQEDVSAPVEFDTGLDASGMQMDPKRVHHRLALLVSDGHDGGGDFVRFLPPPAAGRVSVPRGPAAAVPGIDDAEELSAAADVGTNDENPASAEIPAAGTPMTLAALAVSESVVANEASEMDAQQRRVERLLQQAETAIGKDRLLIPRPSSAFHFLQQVLEIDAQNERALEGLQNIVERYGVKADQAMQKQSFDRARRFIDRALRVDPDNQAILAMRSELDARVASAEAEALAAAEMARLAALAEDAQAAEEPAPQVSPVTSYEVFMGEAEGI